MLGLHLSAASIEGNLRVLAIGAHPDDIEIGCGATVLRLAEALSGGRDPVGRPDRRRRACGGGSAERCRLRGRLRCVEGRRRGFSRCVPSVRGRRGQGVLRGPQVGVLSGPDPHSSARRPAPGPQAGLRAHVEHVARPPDPRVRDPQVRRRSRCAEPVRPSGRLSGAAEDRPATRPLRLAARPAVVHRGPVSLTAPGARYGVELADRAG